MQLTIKFSNIDFSIKVAEEGIVVYFNDEQFFNVSVWIEVIKKEIVFENNLLSE